MEFNSIDFAIFFVIVFLCHAFARNKWQNRILLIASYLFYASWDWRFTGLILLSTSVDYLCGIQIHKATGVSSRRFFLAVSLVTDIGILAFFKYFNFFTDSLNNLLHVFGLNTGYHGLNLALPLGISFYTFRAMSYIIDIYRKQQEPTKDFTAFALFIAFFPHVVAGPIERASHFIPQALSFRRISYNSVAQGSFLIMYGLFQKVVVAENLAIIANNGTFDGHIPGNTLTALLAIYAYAFQIYCDFAGYSNMARGTAACLGFDLMVNFRTPYFCSNPREFWKRWHISLSTWLRDYLYIPLGGSRNGVNATLRNLMITMLIGGLWHGAAWTFVFWGGYHGFLLVSQRLYDKWTGSMNALSNPFTKTLWAAIKWLFFFHLICIGWIFFRASSLDSAISLLQALFAGGTFAIDAGVSDILAKIIPFMPVALAVDLYERKTDDLLSVTSWPLAARVFTYLLLFYEFVIFGVNNAQSFIYTKF